MSDLGDISDFLKEGSLADLNWLDVKEQDVRDVGVLPKQNLDISPDLEAQWSHEDKSPSAYFVPNRDMAGYPVDPKIPQAPTTMGDLSQLHGPLNPVVRLARLTLMQSDDIKRWQNTLRSKFSSDQLLSNKTALAETYEERGLIGRLYVDAADFPGCSSTKSAASQDFVRKYASKSLMVVQKTACGDCSHNQSGRCDVFQKPLAASVEYTEALAQRVEAQQQATGFKLQASAEKADPRSRIQAAYLHQVEASSQFTGQVNSGAVVPVERLLRKSVDVAAQEESIRKAKAEPVVSMVRRELLKGRNANEVGHGLKLAFGQADLEATAQYWLPILKEAGLYGSVYSTQDSFTDCREGADFLSKHGSKVRAIVAGNKCGSCFFSKAGSCMMYGRKLVASTDEVYTAATVAAVLDEHKMAGTIAPYDIKQHWGATPREALQNIHKTAAATHPIHKVQQPRMDIFQAYHGGDSGKTASDLVKRDVIKTARIFMNEGLYGSDLQRALSHRFDPRDIVATQDELRVLLADQGLQGTYFVDPTAYEDYGKGCVTAQRKHRQHASVKYAKAGDKCGSCVHQTIPGTCSVLSKTLVQEVPYVDKALQQKAILASGTSTLTNYATLVNNGLTMMQEFELTGGSGGIDLNPQAPVLASAIEFGNNKVDVTKL